MKLYRVFARGSPRYPDIRCEDYVRCESEAYAYEWVSSYIAREKGIRSSMVVDICEVDSVPPSYSREPIEILCNHRSKI